MTKADSLDLAADAQASKAKRFTTQYVPLEDRIQILVERTSDDVQVLWLTRRLLNKLVPTLLDKLVKAPVDPSVPKPKVEAVQQFTQAAAVGNLKKQKNVLPSSQEPGNHEATLIKSVDVTVRPKSLELIFKSDVGVQKQSLEFEEAPLRQWLSILHSRYRVAGWSEPFWPSWITSPAPAVNTERLN
jgi:hypothetical protein